MLTIEEWRAIVYRARMVLDSAAETKEPVFTQYRHNAKGAIAALKKAGGGVAIAALHHPEIGDIDLRWGDTSDDPRRKGKGLAKIIRWHPDVLHDLQKFVSSLKVYQKHKNEIHLHGDGGKRGAVRVSWNHKSGHWLLTAYIKGVSASKDWSAALDHVSGPTQLPQTTLTHQIVGFEA